MKILYFDYWTKGLPHNILPLDGLLREEGFERILVHVGSWRDHSVKQEEIICGLLCRDIGYYGGNLRKMLIEESPDAVYVLNVGGTLDRLVNRVCRNLGIKTIFLMHGVLPLGDNIDVEKRRLNKAFTIATRLRKVPKYFKIYRSYLWEIARTNLFELVDPRTYGHVFQMILSPGSMYSNPWIDKDLYPDLTLVYSEAYRKLFEGTMKFHPHSIKVVGNPQLDSVLQLARAPDSRDRLSNLLSKLGIPSDKPLVVFLVDGLDSGLSSFTIEEWMEELKDVASTVQSFGGRLILKLHPTNDREKVQRFFQSVPDVHVIQTESDLSIVLSALAVIGHISSALIIPIALNIPVLVPQWSNVYTSYDYYVSNGAAIAVESTDDLRNRLQGISVGDRSESLPRAQFLNDFIGILDGGSWRRVAHEIIACL